MWKFLVAVILFASNTEAIVPADFKPSLAKDIVAEINKITKESPPKSVAYIASLPGFSVVVEYTGESREIPTERMKFIGDVGKMLDRPQLTAAYKKEIKVTESKVNYWIPVQDIFYPAFAKELKVDQKFIAFVRAAGKTAAGEQMILMMDFNSAKPAVESFVPQSK